MMNVEELRTYCLSKKEVTEAFPFDNDTLVFKVGGKLFLLCSLETSPLRFNVKCNPEKAIELRGNYACVKPGYHMNKTHWNTVEVDGSVSKKLLQNWIDDSYNLIVNSLPKKDRERILTT